VSGSPGVEVKFSRRVAEHCDTAAGAASALTERAVFNRLGVAKQQSSFTVTNSVFMLQHMLCDYQTNEVDCVFQISCSCQFLCS